MTLFKTFQIEPGGQKTLRLAMLAIQKHKLLKTNLTF